MGKLLIVSTDAGVIQAMSEQFPAGDEFQVETAASGFEAGYLAGDGQFDVVLIDLGKSIGQIEGFHIAGHLCRIGILTVIALAGLDQPMKLLALAGFTHVFYRPFDPAAVAGLVWARIGRRPT